MASPAKKQKTVNVEKTVTEVTIISCDRFRTDFRSLPQLLTQDGLCNKCQRSFDSHSDSVATTDVLPLCPITPQNSALLANGVRIPLVGAGCAFGNWTDKTMFQGFLPELAWRAITLALQGGVRHFDNAKAYGTERHVGTLLGRYFASGSLQREHIFLCTKLGHPAAPPHLGISSQRTWDPRSVPSVPLRLTADMETSLDELGVGYVDLVLLHWPGSFTETDPMYARDNRIAMWKVMESFLKKGIAKAIGVSNFTKQHLEHLIEDGCTVLPMVNQIEVHPYCQDHPLLRYCKEQKILVEAYAPFASGSMNLMQDPVLMKIAKKVGKSVGQVILRWNVQHGRVVLPKSGKLHRIQENLNIFHFQLESADMAAIDALQGNKSPRRTCPDPNTIL
eukprot:gb/GEZN01008974.1/.p1 GENE.gb/GEZN01008974.1/~~gb/GEZN01008974.1/.p1  ORF type:complete len:392 (+),score=30.85 gb/GEZN01008974.1/:47-1222(+)